MLRCDVVFGHGCVNARARMYLQEVPSFTCVVDTTFDVAVDLRVDAVSVTESPAESRDADARSCWSTDSAQNFQLPPTIAFGGVAASTRRDVLNLTDPLRCWQASVTSLGNTPLAQGDCSCDVGFYRPTCEVQGSTAAGKAGGSQCQECPKPPAWHYYTSDGGAFWNGCAVTACVDDCGDGSYCWCWCWCWCWCCMNCWPPSLFIRLVRVARETILLALLCAAQWMMRRWIAEIKKSMHHVVCP